MADNGAVQPITPDVERLLEGLDENLNPIEAEDSGASDTDKAEDKGKEDTQENEEAEQANEADESEEADKDADASDSKDDEKTDGEDDGYTIDEGEEAEEEVTPVSTEEAKKTTQLSAEETYIIENLSPITVRGQVDEKPVEVKVFSPEQLPDGFKFNDDKARSIADKAFGMLESKAQQLQSDFRNQETGKAAKEFEAREKAADRADIADMQREGIIPKFKATPDSKEFDSDPAAKLIQEVLDFKDKENQRFLEEANAGKRPYKHIGFEEAYLKYSRTNPAKTRSPEQTKEDKERKEVARRTSKTSGTEGKKGNAPPEVFKNSRDLSNYIDNLGWE